MKEPACPGESSLNQEPEQGRLFMDALAECRELYRKEVLPFWKNNKVHAKEKTKVLSLFVPLQLDCKKNRLSQDDVRHKCSKIQTFIREVLTDGTKRSGKNDQRGSNQVAPE